MADTAKQILEEEVEKLSQKISSGNFKKVIEEDLNIIDSLTKENLYNPDNQMIKENWNWFKDTLIKAVELPTFQHNCKSINSKLYAVKYFTKINFMIAESVEDEVKFELKKYFGELTTDDINQFVNDFFKLPFEFTSLVVRYLSNVLIPEKKKLLVPNIKDANIALKQITSKKDTFIKNINSISKGQGNNMSFIDVELLLDVRAFYEYSPLNVGTLEFLIRTLESAKEKLNELFTKEKVGFFLQQILTLPSYQKHLSTLQRKQEAPFFNRNGMQNDTREVTYDDCVMKYYDPENFLPRPKVAPPLPVTEPETPEGGEGDSGDMSAIQPTEEELMKQ